MLFTIALLGNGSAKRCTVSTPLHRAPRWAVARTPFPVPGPSALGTRTVPQGKIKEKGKEKGS